MAAGRELTVLVTRLQLEIDQMPTVCHSLAADPAMDGQQIALWIVAPDFGIQMDELRIVTDPVGDEVRHPEAALRAIVIGARCAVSTPK